MIRKYKIQGIITLILVLYISITFSQKKNIVGITLTGEITSASDFVAGIGATFERQLKKHSGFETGIYYRTFKTNGTLQVGGNFYNFIIAERHLSIPFLYKFYSSIINLSVGPTFDFYIGWTQKNKSSLVMVNSYNIDPNFGLGLIGKVSKRIEISKKFILEPEIRFNPILSRNRAYLGIGMGAKYKLTK